MITFKKVRFKNLLSFGDNWTEIQLDRHKSTLVTGKNGSGKSSGLDAITFALYGKPFRKINKTSIVNHKNKKGLIVEILFDVNLDRYKVIRGVGPSVFEIWKNDTLINQDASSRDYQGYLESEILRIDYNAFTQIVVLGKATYVSFMKLKTDERRKFIENILQLNIFSHMNEIHKSNVSNLKEELNSTKSAILVLSEKIALHEAYIEKIENDERVKKDEELARISSVISELQADIDILLGKVTYLNSQRVRIDTEVLQSVEKKIKSLSEFRVKISAKEQQLLNNINFFVENNICPTCSQLIEEDTKHVKVSGLQDKIEQIQVSLTDISNKNESATEQLSKINFDIENNNNIERKIDSYQVLINEKQRRIKEYTGNKNRMELSESKDLQNEKSKLQLFRVEYDRLVASKNALLDESEYYDLASGMLKDTGIKRMVIRKYIPLINSIVNSHLKNLGFFARFSLDEDFNETILARGMDELSYYNFSEGEKFRIDLAILMTWRDIAKLQNNMACNLLFFDEILDGSLDESGTDSLIELLDAQQQINIFVITHSPDRWIDKFRSIISFGKENGFSKILT